MKKLLLKFVSTICISAVMLGGVSYAEGLPPEVQKRADEIKLLLESKKDFVMEECQTVLTELYDKELTKLFFDLENGFRSANSTSSISNNLIARFVKYRAVLRTEFSKVTVAKAKLGVKTSASDSYFSCVGLTEEYIDLGKDMLVSGLIKNSSQKRTTMLAEKFKALSEKMRDMNLTVADMFSYYKTFQNKLPRFLQECITSL